MSKQVTTSSPKLFIGLDIHKTANLINKSLELFEK